MGQQPQHSEQGTTGDRGAVRVAGMTPINAVRTIKGAMIRLGFYPAGRSRGASYYLRYRPLPFKIRLSDHRRRHRKQQNADVVINFVCRTNMTDSEARETALSLAVRYIAACNLRISNNQQPMNTSN